MNKKNLPSTLYIFEDDRFPNFFPLSLYKPLYDLRIGMENLGSRLIYDLDPAKVVYLCRPYLATSIAEDKEQQKIEKPFQVNSVEEENSLFLNARLLTFGDELGEMLQQLEGNSLFHKNGRTVAAWLDAEKVPSFVEYILEPLGDENITRILQRIGKKSASSDSENESNTGDNGKITGLVEWSKENEISVGETGINLLSHTWQLIGNNARCIKDDYQKNPLRGTAPESELFKGVNMINEEDIVIGSEVEVRSGTVLDASDGPVVIDSRAIIEPNAIIFGPCFIGNDSVIRGGAKIGQGTTIGSYCKVGGEVEETVILSYSNKQHEGFLGHSYVGSWVNMGAGCCNSDLKNNYGHIDAWSAGEIRKTGRRFLGAVIGDHSKIAINTRINTGTVIGFCSNVMPLGFTPQFIPSFTWRMEPDYVEYGLDEALSTAEIMMDRRGIEFSPAIKDLFTYIYKSCRQSGHKI